MAAVTGLPGDMAAGPQGDARAAGAAAARDYNPSMYELLKTINDPADLRKLDRKDPSYRD